ncbi:hypothetical protein B0H13DRAFT_2036711, partial [Mycena leptocephala]
MSMTACWPAFPSTTAPCTNAASAFTRAPSLALVAHARTAHPGSGYPLLAAPPPHRRPIARALRRLRAFRPPRRTPPVCARRICVRAASAQCRALLAVHARPGLFCVVLALSPTPRSASSCASACAACDRQRRAKTAGSYEDAPARIRRALAAVGTCKRSVGATSLSSRLATHIHLGFPMRTSCRAVCRTRPGFDVRAALLATPNAGVWVRSILHCPRWRCIHGREWPALRAAGHAG